MSTAVPLRTRLKDVVRTEIQVAADALFLQHGFDDVSVEDIAAAAGVSPRTFFRYFATKEDVALQWLDDTGPLIRDALRRQPHELNILLALRAAFVEMAVHDASGVSTHSRFVHSLSYSSSKLRAGFLVRQETWTQALSVVVAERLGQEPTDLEPQIWAGIALAVATASADWGHRAKVEDVPQLMSDGFAVLISKVPPAAEVDNFARG